MTYPIQVPSDIVQKWQGMVDLLAEIMHVPSALIMKVEPPNIKVFVASESKGNPWERDEVASLNGGTYCETVMETRQLLLVPDALQDDEWKSNPDIELGMISYLGLPISWPDGEIFGTICVLDSKRNEYSEVYRKLLLQCRDVSQADLRSLVTVHRELELIKRAPPRKDRLDINEAIREMIELTRGEAVNNGVSMRTKLADGLPIIQADRVELQRVLLNLIVNAIEAMSGVDSESRELLITTGQAEPNGVLVALKDSGPGLAPASLERVFDPFYTTKPGGLGMGLSLCRSIIEAHGGRLWATANIPQGATFQFTLPAHPDNIEQGD